MKKEDCIFCKIANNEIPSQKIRENDKFYAFLDLSPNCKGQCLLIPKEHYDSDLFLIDDNEFYKRYFSAAKEVVELLKKSLKVVRVWMIMEGMGVNHLHIKLYPMRWLDKDREPIEEQNGCYFDTYPGYLTTQMWETLSQEKLAKIKEEIVWK